MAEPKGKEKSRDRKLGDEWADWDGNTGSREKETNERLATFLMLSAGIVLMIMALIPAGWYLIKPRVEQLSLVAAQGIEWVAVCLAAVLILSFATEVLWIARAGKSLFPYRWTERLLLALLPKTVWLGARLGISRDRVGNSFIKAHNLWLKRNKTLLNTKRVLVLLPRCLSKESRAGIISRLNGTSCTIVTAGGGEEARAAIMQHRPTFIIAFACERDLMSGIKDIAEKVPVLAVPNKRPDGPCKNTMVSPDELDEALAIMAAGKD